MDEDLDLDDVVDDDEHDDDGLLNDAADSPITEQGAVDQYRVGIGLTRRISLDF